MTYFKTLLYFKNLLTILKLLILRETFTKSKKFQLAKLNGKFIHNTLKIDLIKSNNFYLSLQ